MRSVRMHYDENVELEWERLERHRTEFAVSLRVILEHLPKPPASVLDVGCGPGRYALALAERGYDVSLVDLSRASLDFAVEKAGERNLSFSAVHTANAMTLEPIESSSFEAVLLMGPLYHLQERDQRLRALGEARRVLKAGGLIFAAFITRFAPFRFAAVEDAHAALEDPDYFIRLLATGVHDQSKVFPNPYFAHPKEIEPLMEEGGFEKLLLIGCEGVVAGHEDRVNQLSGEDWEAWVELNYRMGKDPYLFGASDHLLFAGRKPGRG